MLRKELNIRQRYHPIPIAVLISTANSCDCDIYVEYGKSRVNVKDYAATKRGFNTQNPNVWFYFNGCHEIQAEQRIEHLFAP